ncbi:MAG TPA: hypothetical protein VFP52_12390 [Myxococcales bacterium]|nr:hypothetical protein [Myxococcales bacterium]
MRRRIELAALLLVLLAAAAGWIFREQVRAARWSLQGQLELASISPAAGPGAGPAPLHVAHAAGAYQGLRYTNALGALEHNYRRGVRWFEIDFASDARGKWWAVHDWQEIHRRLGIPLDRDGRGLPDAPDGLSPLMDVEGVLQWFGGHPDARLVTDTKEDNRILIAQLALAPADLRPRIHPQIYRIREYPLARAAGLGAPIFTTYRSRYPWPVLGRFARGHRLLALTATREEADEACRALGGEVPLLIHTVNDPAEEARLLAAGIAGVYTDDLLP